MAGGNLFLFPSLKTLGLPAGGPLFLGDRGMERSGQVPADLSPRVVGILVMAGMGDEDHKEKLRG
jgi:hypothetical protein